MKRNKKGARSSSNGPHLFTRGNGAYVLAKEKRVEQCEGGGTSSTGLNTNIVTHENLHYSS